MLIKEVMDSIKKERERQHTKFGFPQSHNIWEWNAVLMEEVGEVSEALLKGSKEELQKELVQVAAVCVAILEHM